MHRVTDYAEVRSVTDQYPEYFTFDIEKWFSDDRNVCLKEGDNVTFGEYKTPGVYHVHFCYGSARGREAISLTKDMFRKFCQDHPVKIGIGLIHHQNRKALWVIRQVGFTSLGMIETENGLCEMFASSPTKEI